MNQKEINDIHDRVRNPITIIAGLSILIKDLQDSTAIKSKVKQTIGEQVERLNEYLKSLEDDETEKVTYFLLAEQTDGHMLPKLIRSDRTKFIEAVKVIRDMVDILVGSNIRYYVEQSDKDEIITLEEFLECNIF